MENGELADLGLRAFHGGDFTSAIAYLSDLTKRDASLWHCRLYLAMAYCQVSQVGNAVQELKDIAQWCPDRVLREKAMVLLKEMNRQSMDNLKVLQNHSLTQKRNGKGRKP